MLVVALGDQVLNRNTRTYGTFTKRKLAKHNKWWTFWNQWSTIFKYTANIHDSNTLKPRFLLNNHGIRCCHQWVMSFGAVAVSSGSRRHLAGPPQVRLAGCRLLSECTVVTSATTAVHLPAPPSGWLPGAPISSPRSARRRLMFGKPIFQGNLLITSQYFLLVTQPELEFFRQKQQLCMCGLRPCPRCCTAV